jgi:hypothetical protein
MKKTTISLLALLSVSLITHAQVVRDGGGSEASGIDWLSVGIGVVVGLLIGYLLGSRRKA